MAIHMAKMGITAGGAKDATKIKRNFRKEDLQGVSRRGGIMNQPKLGLQMANYFAGANSLSRSTTLGKKRDSQPEINYDAYPAPQLNAFQAHTSSYMDFKSKAE